MPVTRPVANSGSLPYRKSGAPLTPRGIAKDNSADAIVEAVRAGRTIAYDLDGRAYGPPALLEQLEVEPVEVRSSDYNYAGSGWLDRTTRTLGWLGLFGFLVLRPTRWRRG